MADQTSAELQLEHEFDSTRCRHYLNGSMAVLHCHHFTTLYSQLADDAEIVDGKTLLAEAAEETFLPVLSEYYEKHGIKDTAARVAIAEKYYAAVGLGLMRVVDAGDGNGTVELSRSHVDEGWIKKWGKRDAPVNFITQGFIAGLFGAILNQPAGTFVVTEEQSIVSGAEKSVFQVARA